MRCKLCSEPLRRWHKLVGKGLIHAECQRIYDSGYDAAKRFFNRNNIILGLPSLDDVYAIGLKNKLGAK